MSSKFYTLPTLPYSNDALSPILSKDQVEIHYGKHHRAYVEKANELLKKIDDSRDDGDEIDVGVVAKKLSFNAGGNTLHSLFWKNLIPASDYKPVHGEIKDKIEDEYGTIERFISEFTECATTIEGSGWVALTCSVGTGRLLISQVANHNLYLIPEDRILLVLDMWEHAYYLDYKNDKKLYANNFWRIVNWEEVERRNQPV